MFDPKEFKKFAIHSQGVNSAHIDRYMETSVPNINNFTPQVIEERQMNVVGMDVFSRLMMDRIIFLGVGINDYVANVVQAQLLFLQSTDPKRDIQMYVNSPGGSVIAGLGMYDTMQYVSPDVGTICTGLAASMGAVLLAAGAKGKRSILPHARAMIHQPMGGMQGQVSDMEINYNLIKQLQKNLYDILSYHTGQDYDTIEKDSDRDNWMTAEEAKSYGIVDEVLDTPVSKLRKEEKDK
ncbi:MAG: ATP-dependent Clp protease proteolytic subunit [Bacteroidetes bacterium]|jgi:ATP-dependent Clp protease protease subunit|nr:ATP-dependent Clp protease proteolytic subunit [Bacteroidota bacterium]